MVNHNNDTVRFDMVNRNNDTVRFITRSKVYSPRSIIANYRYFLYKYKFSHLNFYSDIGDIVNKIRSKVNDDYIKHTVKEWIELRDHVSGKRVDRVKRPCQ